MIRRPHRRIVRRAMLGAAVCVVWVGIAGIDAARATSSGVQGSQRPASALSNVVTLTTGAAVERAISPGEEQAFQVSIAQGEVLRVAVDQWDADVSVRLEFAGEAPVTINDETKHHYGRELDVWQAPARGDVRLTVRSVTRPVPPVSPPPPPPSLPATPAARDASSGTSDAGRPARYRLTISILPPSDVLARAMSTRAEALRLSREDGGKDAKATLQKLREAVDAWRAQGDRELLAQSLSQLGHFYVRPLNQPADCITTLTEALAIYESLTLPSEIAAMLVEIGDAQLMTGALAQGRATHERAYTYAGAIDPLDRAWIEHSLAKAHQFSGDFDRAVMFELRAIETFRAAGGRRDEFLALEQLAQTYQRMQRYEEALRAATDAIALAREHGRGDDLATLTRTLGMIHLASGDADTALSTLRTALDLFKGHPPSRIATMLQIGRVYNQMGDARQAREWLEKTLAAVPPQLQDYWAATASELGRSLTILGEPARALDLQRKAIGIVTGRSTIGELSMLPDLAATCRALNDLACAQNATARASEAAETFPGRPYSAIVLRERARDARAAGDLPLARQHLDAALEVIESTRGRLHSQALRASFGGVSGGYYDEAIDLAMQMHQAAPGEGHDARALELFERSRARSLGDLLAEARSDIRSGDIRSGDSRSGDSRIGDIRTSGIRTGVDPLLLAEQRSLQTQLGQRATALRDLAGKSTAADRAPILDREIDDLVRRLAVLDGKIRETSPRYAALTHPAPLSIGEIQQLLDDDTVWLALSSGPSRLQPGRVQAGWGWALTRHALRSFPLPEGRRIEEAARKVYSGLAARQRYTTADGVERRAQIDRDLAVDAAALSDLVLGPIAGALHGEWRTRRLAIVATGALEYIPFAALPVPALPMSTAASPASRAWLVETHELVQLPSASVLARLREDAPRRAPASRTLAVLADAVYAADDPRVNPRLARHTPAASAKSHLRGLDTDGLRGGLRGEVRDGFRDGFRRLVFSREEADVITRLAGRGALEALDFKANLATMASPAVANARIVHIASHGILNSTRPELSGLVLSLVDEAGRPREGVLRLYDVFNLKLAADLVVLSACETGLGRQMKSEGFVGLARGFMYAGAPRVVASLWQVDDLATTELMHRFYRGMLVRKLSAAAALRAAQDEMRTSTQWRAPYYWAAFTLMGDWR